MTVAASSVETAVIVFVALVVVVVYSVISESNVGVNVNAPIVSEAREVSLLVITFLLQE